MILLVGISDEIYQEEIEGDFKSHLSEKVVATFDTEEQARGYVESNRLKEKIRKPFDAPQVFRKDSLLGDCVDYEIRGYETVPHNPR